MFSISVPNPPKVSSKIDVCLKASRELEITDNKGAKTTVALPGSISSPNQIAIDETCRIVAFISPVVRGFPELNNLTICRLNEETTTSQPHYSWMKHPSTFDTVLSLSIQKNRLHLLTSPNKSHAILSTVSLSEQASFPEHKITPQSLLTTSAPPSTKQQQGTPFSPSSLSLLCGYSSSGLVLMQSNQQVAASTSMPVTIFVCSTEKDVFQTISAHTFPVSPSSSQATTPIVKARELGSAGIAVVLLSQRTPPTSPTPAPSRPSASLSWWLTVGVCRLARTPATWQTWTCPLSPCLSPIPSPLPVGLLDPDIKPAADALSPNAHAKASTSNNNNRSRVLCVDVEVQVTHGRVEVRSRAVVAVDGCRGLAAAAGAAAGSDGGVFVFGWRLRTCDLLL